MFKQGDKIAIISMQNLLQTKKKLFGEQDPATTSVMKHLQEMKE